ncbi:MAG: transposase [Marinobacterium sp.]|nr:transposase [Marinobacterium sp.]
MPDHLHWLMQLRDCYSLSQVIHFVKSRAARAVNLAIGRQGRFWRNGYYDHALRREGSVSECARYIVANPLRAGLVKTVGDYALWNAAWLAEC